MVKNGENQKNLNPFLERLRGKMQIFLDFLTHIVLLVKIVIFEKLRKMVKKIGKIGFFFLKIEKVKNIFLI